MLEGGDPLGQENKELGSQSSPGASSALQHGGVATPKSLHTVKYLHSTATELQSSSKVLRRFLFYAFFFFLPPPPPAPGPVLSKTLTFVREIVLLYPNIE